jgi:hypothetical protein
MPAHVRHFLLEQNHILVAFSIQSSSLRNADGWNAICEAATAVDEAGLNEAAIERTPGGVGWDEDMGRFKALVKMLRLGDTASLWGLPLPDPKKDGFDAAVEKVFRTFAEQRAPQPLLEAQGAEGGAGPPLQLQQQVPAGLPAPQPPVPPSSTTGEARVPLSPAATAAAAPPAPAPEAAAPAGSPQPMEVEAPPAPAQTEAPPLLVPPSALPSLGLDDLVSQLRDVIAAATLDEDMVGQLLNSLEGLKRSAQEMQKAGAPPPPRTCPPCLHTCTAHPPRHRCPATDLTAPRRRVQAGQHTAQEVRSICAAQSARRRAVQAVDVGRGFRALILCRMYVYMCGVCVVCVC